MKLAQLDHQKFDQSKKAATEVAALLCVRVELSSRAVASQVLSP